MSTWRQCQYPKDSAYVNIQLELAKARFRTGDVKTAISDITNVTQLYKKQHSALNANDQVKAYYRLGFYWKELNEYKKAVTALEEAVKIGVRLPSNEWTAFAYGTLAYLTYSVGEYQKAVVYAEQGMYQAKHTNDHMAYLECWGEKIKSLMALGDNKRSGKDVSSAIATARKLPGADYYLAIFLTYRANLLEADQEPQSALVDYKESLIINKSIHEKKAFLDNCINIGYLLYKIKNYPESLHYYNIGLQNASDPYIKLRLFDDIGAVYWQKKQFATALAYYQAGLNALPLGFNNRYVTSLPKAELIRIASQKEFLLTLIQDKADTWLDYAKATNNQRQRLQYALDTYKVADQMIDFMRWEHTGQLSKFYWRQKTRGLYERAIETCYRLGDTEQAFRFLEKSRAVMLADKLNELGARQQLAPQQIEQEQRLRQSVSDQQAKLAGLSPDSASYAPARTVLMTKQDSLDTFLKQLEGSNPAYYRYKYDNTTTSLASLQQHLQKRQSSLVTYFVGDSALYVMGVTADTVMLKKQPIGAYTQTLNQFVPFLANAEAMRKMNDVRRFLVVSNNLFRQLLAPLALPKGRVVVSPDGFFIPFDALSRSATQADYAVNDYAFSYAYSASLLLKNGATKTLLPSFQTGDFLGIAPVDFAPALKQVMLSGSDKALTSIAEQFDSPMLLTHKSATRRAFQQEAPNYPVVLLFTHATADSTDQEPMLYFADSTLRLSDLGDKALPNAQLVVLAACKTGIGTNQRGEGVFSLARGFSALGVPSVLTTLWSVENKATYQLTALFYKYLDEGFSKDIALQRAKQDWLKTADGANQLPNYWAGLIIVGDAEPLSHPNHWLWVAVGLVIFLLGVVSWQYYRKRRIRQSRYAIA